MYMHQFHGHTVLHGRIMTFFGENNLLTPVTFNDLCLTFDPVHQVECLKLMNMHQFHGRTVLYGRIMKFSVKNNEIDHLTPLMTFDPDEKKYTCTQAKCIVPI